MTAYDKIKEALEKAQEKEYTNGMATGKDSIYTQYGYINVIHKCGDLKHPEIFLLIIKPNEKMGHIEPNNSKLSEILEQILGLRHTDLNVVMKSRYGYDNEYTCIIPVKLF